MQRAVILAMIEIEKDINPLNSILLERLKLLKIQ